MKVSFHGTKVKAKHSNHGNMLASSGHSERWERYESVGVKELKLLPTKPQEVPADAVPTVPTQDVENSSALTDELLVLKWF